ncbi:hypothetical protein TNCV_2594901 [Trichonephila clavipes]|nr:hypothetical protein TNCV_2594901 [Trichonephila clavipes]
MVGMSRVRAQCHIRPAVRRGNKPFSFLDVGTGGAALDAEMRYVLTRRVEQAVISTIQKRRYGFSACKMFLPFTINWMASSAKTEYRSAVNTAFFTVLRAMFFRGLLARFFFPVPFFIPAIRRPQQREKYRLMESSNRYSQHLSR